MEFKAVFQNREQDYSVPLSELKAGQVGQLTVAPGLTEYTVGYLVQWSAGDGGLQLREVGGRTSYWGSVVPGDPRTHRGARVRILRDGDKLVADGDGKLSVEWAGRDLSIPLKDLKPGQIGEIITCGYTGTLLTRIYREAHPDSAQFLDGTDAFLDLEHGVAGERVRVRVLRPGDRITVTE